MSDQGEGEMLIVEELLDPVALAELYSDWAATISDSLVEIVTSECQVSFKINHMQLLPYK